MTEVVAVIPARGGSKGVPRKNVRRVGGVPLVARAIAAARATASVERVFVSTDDQEIAAVAQEWGAHVIARPAELADDEASSESVLLHALDALEDQGIIPEVLVFLQATSPFIDPRDIDVAIDLVAANEHDCVFSAIETYGFVWAADAGIASGVNHDPSVRPRRQDREPHYLETGAFYVMDAAGFRDARHRFFGRVGLVEVAERTAIEIDSEEQLALAQAIAPLFAHDNVLMGAAAVVTDFDGVHTDDTVHTDADGRESVRVSRSDGMGIARLRRAGIPVLILSAETNPVVSARARKLEVDVLQGVQDKVGALREWAKAQGVPLSRIAYIGNDINDLGCLEVVGFPVAVPEAHPLVLAAARVVVSRTGGHGAVRELADRVLRDQGDPGLTTALRSSATPHEGHH
ncbi:acylneuraminate cytidylyltransferase [Microbacterium sp.]|uniref:acylneuraminate cytidylyltransferase n=1 Tax=Microbacterium sp. TaxID=51671 RepID=UPI0025CBE4EC|nr:acylneuraminate cytidylyltransferase [Microbacterium sp.]